MNRHDQDIAIIGMAGRFPGATTLQAFWENLRGGRDSISRFDRSELLASDYALDEVADNPGFVPARGVLEDIDLFDAQFFGFRPREAVSLDPQQRVWFECAWEALENAGIAPSKTDERIGVFAGGGYLNTYLMLNLCQDRDAVERLVRLRSVDAFQNIINNDKDFLPTRTSHVFGLTGPSVNVQTACSTSLVSVVMAAQSLVLGESDVCLAGGISIQLPQVRGYLAQDGGMDSFDGVVRPFDAKANGTVFGNGVGVVVLKRLAEARRDGDRVLAVLKGYALNNDGARRASYVAPSLEGQMDVIRRALEMAGGDAGALSYVEAHGTGTSTGDPIEVQALSSVYAESVDRRGFCGIGSVKGNVGHLDSAAGVVGLIKVLLALEHEELPPSIHFEKPNPNIDFGRSPFYVVRKPTAWSRTEAPRRAAVSSFGVGGTNAHVIVEEPPARPAAADDEAPQLQLLALSAKSEAALDARCADLARYLDEAAPPLAGVASALMNRREDMRFRRFLVAVDRADAVAGLQGADAQRLVSGTCESPAPGAVFLFPGQGAQHPGMAQGLYDSEPVFREAFEECSTLFEPLVGTSLCHLLYPSEDAKRSAADDCDPAEALIQTRLAQPAMFAVEIALARLWMHWGVKPSAMFGHSLGDFTAACLAGVFSLPDAVTLIAARSKLMQACDPGSMLAIQRPRDAVIELLADWDRISLAAENGPMNCVVAGPDDDVQALAADCAGRDIETRLLHTSHAFHSEMMRPAAESFREVLSGIDLNPPQIPMVSSRTGRLLTAAEATDPEFWASQILEPVRFHDGLRTAAAESESVFLEVGPGTTLSSLARQAGVGKAGVVISTLGHPDDKRPDRAKILEAVGRVWIAGALPQPSPLFRTDAPAVTLPTYPFQRSRYWIDAPVAAQNHEATPQVHASQPTLPTESAMSTPTTTPPTRLPSIRAALAEVFEEYSGLDVEDEGSEVTFLEMGFDSLFLTQIATALQNQFGVRMKFRRMLEDLCTLDRLAEFFDAELPPEEFAVPEEPAAGGAVDDVSNATPAAPSDAPAPHPATPAPNPVAPVPAQSAAPSLPGPVSAHGAPDPAAHDIVQQQLAIMQQQLALLAGASGAERVGSASGTGAVAPMDSDTGHGERPQPPAQPPAPDAAPASRSGAHAPDAAAETPSKPQAFGAQARISTENEDEFTPRQRECFDAFLERYVAKTGKSKAFTQDHRRVMSDPRVVTGFRPLWKELVYPIVVERSKGSRLWDLDGNEYVDLTCGFGSNFLGNQPEFLTDAIHEQVERGYEVGPQHPLTADVAMLISELTGMERVAFCNTGSEAVMGAMRAARTITGRSLVAIFSNSYHGIFDEVIVRGTKKLRSIAAAPGILASAVENVLVLEYGAPETLEILRERGHELAAIMAEPVQSRNPKLQPREFLQELRGIADECGAALIFDEVITGFRISPGGAQEYFGVRADLATYGKIIGGGLPFAAIAGGSRFMDALDGGHWAFGDDSYPEVGVTYFAGTFVRHPLALAAAKASLEHLKAQGPALQQGLNERTSGFVEGLRGLFERTGAPITIDQFGSLCRLTVSEDEPFGSLLYYWLRYHGVHIWEGFGTFLTTSHSEEDVRHLHQAFESSIRELQEGDLLSGSSASDGRGASATLTPEAPVTDRDRDAIPLTEAQQEIWHAAQMGPAASCAYNECFTLELEGALDVNAFQDAVEWVSSRHEALRLRFDADGEHQRLVPFEAQPLPVHDWRNRSEDEASRKLAAVLDHEATEPFDLEKGPLIRDALYRLGDSRWVFVSTAHHIVFDGWSAGVYVDDIGQAYSRLKDGEKPDLPPAPGFVDYIVEEAREVDSETGKGALEHWKGVFNDPPPPLELPLVRERPPRRSFAARSLHWRFADDTYQAARRAAARSNTTLYSLLFAAFGAYLSRLTGQDDIVVGIPTAGQASTGQYGLIGHCVNILPVRVKIPDDAVFGDYLAETARLILDAQEQQPATLGAILRNAPIQRLPGRPPLVEVVFNLNRKLPEESFEGLKTRIREVEKRSSNWDMFLNCSEEEGQLTTDFDYNADLFDAQSIRGFLEGFEHLLAAVAENVAHPLAELPIMSSDAAESLVALGRGAEVAPEAATLPDLVASAVQRDPDRTAVRWGDRSMSYRELDESARTISAALRSLGVEGGSGVGVGISRSPEMPAVMLGVAGAGAFYVPVDPTGPSDRNAHILRDAGVRLLIVDESARSSLEDLDIPMADVRELLSETSSSAAPTDVPAATDPAYRLYTSGSTGQPKGVEISHGALANLLTSMRDEPGFGADDVLLAVTTVSFDIAQLELFLPLIAGGTVVLAPDEVAEDAVALIDCLKSNGISVLQATPTHWRMLVESGLQRTEGLRAFVGGEALPAALAAALIERCDEVWNLYGPTETTIWSTCCRLDEPALKDGVPIGRPIRNTSAYLLDRNCRLVPRGAVGELWIGGAGVAAGYPNLPDLTANRFRPDPFRTGERMYRTGDLGRWRRDDTLEFLHRVDEQLKIRGFRVEPGDVEASLREQEGIRDAVVRRWEPASGDVRLVGYIVPDEGVVVRSGELRESLRAALPEYMVPQHFVPITNIPRTANGKVDRRSLPDPGQAGSPTRRDEPLDELQEAVRDAWQAVLGVDRIGPHDDFFELGGHSVLAARVVSRLREDVEPALAFRHVFEAPTVAQLAEEIENLRFARAGTDAGSVEGEELIL